VERHGRVIGSPVDHRAEHGPPSKLPFWPTVRADIEATTHPNFRYYSNARFWLRAGAKLIISPSVRVVLIFRIAHLLAEKGLLPVALLLRTRGIRISGAELNPLANIGPGLYLAHSVGVGIGAYVDIGANCKMHVGAVVGPQPRERAAGEVKRTVIGDDVYIGTHAVVLGGVTVGDGAMIGANAVVMRDVEPYTVISASPGRVVGRRDPDEPAPG
jgi:serine O-acetyltransferase